MKEKIKNNILTISIFYSVIVIVLMIFNLSNIVVSVELHMPDKNIDKISEYKKRVALLEKNGCTDVINKIINYYEETSYDGEVNIKKIYNIYEEGFLSYFMDVKDNCNLTDEIMDKYNFQSKFLSAAIQPDEIAQRYMFQYELSFKDLLNRDIAEANLNNIEYTIRKNLELEIIKILIEVEESNE